MTSPLPTKAQLIDEVLWMDAIATQALAKAKALRARHEAVARAEYAIDGVAPSWRHPSCTIPLSISSDRYDVTDRKAWMDWVAERHPMQVEEIVQVRPAFEKAMLDRFASMGEEACTEDGEIPPGLTYKPGGEAKGISIRYAKGAKDALGELAGTVLAQMTQKAEATA